MENTKRAHAILSASGSHRWLACPPSARLEEQFPDKTSIYAEEGTLAHELAELKVRYLVIGNISEQEYYKERERIEAHELYKPDMAWATNEYWEHVAAVSEGAELVETEIGIDLSDFAPESFGRCDCVVISGSTLHVIDYKHGKGVVVSPKDNPQLMLYGVGALMKYWDVYPNINSVIMTIVQPRTGNIAGWTLSTDDLLSWAFSIKPIADKAFKGEGALCVGEHCRFCRVATCRARANMSLRDVVVAFKESNQLKDDEIAYYLANAENTLRWYDSLLAYVNAEMAKGKTFKHISQQSGRGRRKISQEKFDKMTMAAFKRGYDSSDFYVTKPKSITEIRNKVLEYKDLDLLDEATDYEPGALKIVVDLEDENRIKEDFGL